jgi:hypothetical protein
MVYPISTKVKRMGVLIDELITHKTKALKYDRKLSMEIISSIRKSQKDDDEKQKSQKQVAAEDY